MSEAPRLASPPQDSLRLWLPLILGLAVGVRVALGWMHPFEFPDSQDYLALARAITAHQPYANAGLIAARMPGYPLLLAVIMFFGGGVKAAMVVQGFMGGAVVLLAYLVGRRMGESVGLLAAAFLALDPLSIGFSAAVLSESPFTLTLMLALWLTLRLSESPRPALGKWIALGLLWAGAVYLRPSALWLIAPLSLYAALAHPPQRPRLLAACIPLAATFILLLPWQVRNYSHFHSGFFRLTTLEGISLYEAVYPDADGGPRQDKIALPVEMVPLNEAQRNDEWSRRAWANMRADPLRIGRLAVTKVGRTWSPWFSAAEFRAGPIQMAMALWNIPLFLFGLFGLIRMPRKMGLLLLIPLAYFTLLHALFLGSVRYRAPLMPLVCLGAAAGIVACVTWIKRSKRLSY